MSDGDSAPPDSLSRRALLGAVGAAGAFVALTDVLPPAAGIAQLQLSDAEGNGGATILSTLHKRLAARRHARRGRFPLGQGRHLPRRRHPDPHGLHER